MYEQSTYDSAGTGRYSSLLSDNFGQYSEHIVVFTVLLSKAHILGQNSQSREHVKNSINKHAAFVSVVLARSRHRTPRFLLPCDTIYGLPVGIKSFFAAPLSRNASFLVQLSLPPLLSLVLHVANVCLVAAERNSTDKDTHQQRNTRT